MKLPVKLTLTFLLLSITPLAILGYLAYTSSRQTIEQNTQSRLVATTIFKQNELNRWLDSSGVQLRQFARRPLFREYAAILTNPKAAESDIQAGHEQLLFNHLAPTLEEEVGFLEYSVLDSRTGRILVSTDPDQEGKYREHETYFIEGQKGTFVDNVRYSINRGQAEMYASTPIKDETGAAIAVLAGRLDLSIMTEIMLQDSGLNPTEETYLVNAFNFFVTNPKFSDDVALKQAVYTPGVQACLAGNSGVGFYNDYRGMPVMGAYRWLPERELCILTEVDQAEAFAPIYRLRAIIAGVGGLAAVVVALLGIFFARSITTPIEQLVTGALAIGQGNLDYRINIPNQDEFGRLAGAFNQMAARRQEIEQTLQEQQIFLQSIYQNTELAIFVIDVPKEGDFRFAGFNPAHERLTGLKSDDVAGKTLDEALIPHIPPEAVAAVRANYSRCIQANRAIEYEEMIPMGNRNTWWLTKLSPVRNAEQRIYRIIGSAIHITERKQIEEELRQARDELERRVEERTEALRTSEAELRALIEAMPDLVLVLDGDGRYLKVPQTHSPLLYKPANALVGRTVDEMLPAHLAGNFRERIRRVLDTGRRGESFEYSLEIDGREVWFSAAISPVLENAVLWVARDITERKQAEAQLKASEERFRALIQNSSDLIMIIDTAGVLQFNSPSIETLLGYGPEDWIGQSLFELIHPDDRPIVNEAIAYEVQVEGATANATVRVRHQDGSWRVFEGPGQNLLHHPAIRGIVINARDITEVKRAEDALRESEERFRLLVNSMDDIIFTLDHVGRHTGVFGHWVEKAGLTPDFFLGRKAREIFGREAAAVHEEANARALAGEAVIYEWSAPGPNGPLYYQTALSPIRAASGEITGLVGVGRDITNLKQIKQALRQSQRNLLKAQRIAHLGSWEMELATGKSVWSDEFFRICGFEPGAFEPTKEIAFN